jgi:hypothetical protein
VLRARGEISSWSHWPKRWLIRGKKKAKNTLFTFSFFQAKPPETDAKSIKKILLKGAEATY